MLIHSNTPQQRPENSNAPLAIKNLVMIGAHLTPQGLSARDQQWLALTQSFCTYARLPLTPTCSLHTPNLADGIDGLDLERTRLHAPLLVLANLLQPRSVWDLCLYALAGKFFKAAKISPFALTTPWPMAARAFQSQMIVTFSRARACHKRSDETTEASAYDFAGSEYVHGSSRFFKIQNPLFPWRSTPFRRDVLFAPAYAAALVQAPQTPKRLRKVLDKALTSA